MEVRLEARILEESVAQGAKALEQALDTSARELVNERKQTLTVASSKFGSLLDSKDFAKHWESFVNKLP